MEGCQIRRLPNLTQDKRLVGIVSLGDLAVHVGDRELSGETLKKSQNLQRQRTTLVEEQH